MKFIFALAPLASLSVAASGASSVASLAYSRPNKNIEFTEEGIHNVLKAASKTKKGNPQAAFSSIQGFFDRNPSVVKSIMKITNEPQYKEAKNDAKAKALELLSSSNGKYDVYSNRIKVLNYIFDHPKLKQMIQEIILKLTDDYPNGAEQFFSTFNKLVKKNPSIIHEIKKEVIDFSKDQEETYYKVFDMVVEGFSLRPRVAARVAILALEADQIACSGSSTSSEDCNCGNNTVEKAEPSINEEPEANETTNVEEPEVAEPAEIEEPEANAEETQVNSSEPEANMGDPETDSLMPEADATESESEEPELAYLRPQ